MQKNKFLPAVLALCLMLSLACPPAYAAEGGQEGPGAVQMAENIPVDIPAPTEGTTGEGLVMSDPDSGENNSLTQEAEEGTVEALHMAAMFAAETGEASLATVQTFPGGNYTAERYYITNNSDNQYGLSVAITASTVDEPVLVLTVPKGLTVLYYPTESDVTLAPSLAASNAVSKVTGPDGGTVLTYRFKANVASIGFNINLRPTYLLPHDADVSVKTSYYAGDKLLAEELASIHTYNPAVADNCVYPYFSYNNNYYNNVFTSRYAALIPTLYFSFSNHYPYDTVQMVVPVPDWAVPGFGEEEGFTPMKDGVAYPISDSYGGYMVTYHQVYTFLDKAGMELGVGQALTFELAPGNKFLTTSSGYYFFNANLFIDFSGLEAGTYNKGIGAQVVVTVDGIPMEKTSHVKTTSTSLTMNFTVRPYTLADYLCWHSYYTTCSYGSSNAILPLEDNHYLYHTLKNRTGEVLTNIKIRYTVDSKLYAGRVTFNLYENHSFYPSRAQVEYRTLKGGDTIYSVTLSSYDKVLALEDKTDAITELTVTYDKLGANNNSEMNLCQLYLCNREGLEETAARRLEMQILSATSPSHGTFDGGWTPAYYQVYLKSRYLGYSSTPWLSGTSLNKGDEFYVGFSGGGSMRMQGASYYIIMPPEYIYVRHTAGGQPSKDYAVTTRTLSDGNILYTVKATDDTDHGYEYHYLYFKVGPAVDTAVVHTETMPRAFLVENNHPMFPFVLDNSYYYAVDTWDCNQNGSTTDLLAKPYSLPTVQINSVNTLYTQGFLSTDVQDGSALTQPYRYDSTGVYRFYVFNGFQSSVEPKDLVVTIPLPSKGTAINYKNNTYTSQWSGRLTGPVTLEGGYWTGAAVAYSTDGGDTYTGHPASWEAVTHIRVTAQAGRALPQSASAIVSLPVRADFPPDMTTSSRAYFTAVLDYTLTGTVYKRETAITEPCTMTAATTDISGTVFRDYNANGVRDENEKGVGKSYTVHIYGGDAAEGIILASAASNSATGAYRLGVLLPGRYTAKVIKGSDEYYNTTGSRFDKDGCYSFTIGGDDQLYGLDLGIISPRTLSLTYSSYNLKSDTPIKLGYTLTPDLLAGEKMAFSSSNPAVVTVSADGRLTYAGDGTATVTITAPQLPAVIAQGGAETLSRTVSVSTQYAGCRVTAAPTVDKGSVASPVTADTLAYDPDGITATYYYRYNRGGYCNDASHSTPNAVKWSITGAGATVTAKGDQATVKFTQAGTFVLTATEVWNHAADRRPEARTVTITVPRAKVGKPVPTIGAYLYDGSIQTVDVPKSPLYTVSGDRAADAGAYTITVTLMDTANYEWADGTTEPVTYQWSIGKAGVTKPTAIGSYVYRAEPQKLVITSSNLYTIVGDTATDAGSYAATVTLKDTKNYLWADGTSEVLTFDWRIDRAAVAFPAVSGIPVYTGAAITAPIPKSGLYAASENTAIGAGSHTAVLTLTDPKNYTWEDGTDGPVQIPWRIARAKVEMPIVSADFVYTGKEQTVPLPESELYTVRGAAATNADSYTATVSLKDTANYEWADGSTEDLTFHWRIGVASVSIPAVAGGVTYTGKEQSCGIREDSRYTVTGGTATNAGSYTATVRLTDSLNYQWGDDTTEPRVLAWAIQRKELTEVMVSISAEKTYTGEPITLGGDDLAVRDGTALNEEDWEVAGYTDNVAAGTAAVTIMATEGGNYRSQIKRQFSILPKACDSEFSIEEIQPQRYTGKEITPEPAVTWIGRALVQGVDYTLSYRDNVEAGDKAGITVTFTGNFTGTLETAFTIYQPSSPTDYAVKVICGIGGTVTPGSTHIAFGGGKTFVIWPGVGYELTALLVDGKAVELTEQYSFRDVRASHTLEARFSPAGLPYYLVDGRRVLIGFAANGKFIAPEGVEVLFIRDARTFLDTAVSQYREDIQFVADRELFIGTQPGRFAPGQVMDRGMTATVLGRLYERSFGPLPNTGLTFDDVAGDDWYAPYAAWSVIGGLLSETDDSFTPDGVVNRGELAAVLSRFAASLGVDYFAEATGDEGQALRREEAAAILRQFITEVVTAKHGSI